jgi:hypothetical protein
MRSVRKVEEFQVFSFKTVMVGTKCSHGGKEICKDMI